MFPSFARVVFLSILLSDVSIVLVNAVAGVTTFNDVGNPLIGTVSRFFLGLTVPQYSTQSGVACAGTITIQSITLFLILSYVLRRLLPDQFTRYQHLRSRHVRPLSLVDWLGLPRDEVS